MKLQDIYDQLSYGELRQLFLGEGDDTTDTTMPIDFKKVLPSVRLALTALHTRFRLRTGTVSVPLELGKQSYILLHPDLLKIEKVFGVYGGKKYEIPLNKAKDLSSIQTPSMNSVLIPSDTEEAPWLLETTALTVEYRQDHTPIDTHVANAAPLVVDVALPITHMEALLYYVASRLHNPLGMDPGAMHEGNNFAQKYEMSCQMLEANGFAVDEDNTNDRLERNGWV